MSAASEIQSQLNALIRIQELDLKIDQLKKKQTEFPAELKDLDARTAMLQKNLDVKIKTSAELEKLIKQNEAAQQLNQDRSARASGKLEQVKTGPEFQAANKEIEQLKRMNAQLSEQILKLKTDLDQAAITRKAAEDELANIKSQRDAKAEEIATRGATLGQEIAALEGQKKEFIPAVKPQTFSQYNRVRAARAGVGIAPAQNGQCGACHILVPPQMYNMIQKGLEIHSCPRCHRILFVPANSSASPSVSV